MTTDDSDSASEGDLAQPRHAGAGGAGFRAGIVVVVGPPNVGKSTLLNRLVGQKIAIATAKPQTTRTRILGIVHRPRAQLVLVDTPGLHRPSGKGRTSLNQAMVKEAESALEDSGADVVLAMISCPDPTSRRKGTALAPSEEFFVNLLGVAERAGKKLVLAVNKTDIVRNKRVMIPFLETWSQQRNWTAIVPISAQSGDNVDKLEEILIGLLPESAPLFPEDQVTDKSERWIGAELVREQIFNLARQEVPYDVAVTIDEWTDRAEDAVVKATIHVAKESQKRILVGQGGSMIRDIGTRARKEMAAQLGRPFHLTLFVRVDERWTEKQALLKEFGYGGQEED
jgi:GTP-binding protein Era